jgi:hypothetical protein
MGQQVLVRAGGTEFYAEVAPAAGPQPVGLEEVLSFDGVRDTIKAVCGQLAEAWEHVKPAEATMEFGLRLVAKQGKLTGLLVEGGREASLKVTLTWRGEEPGKLYGGGLPGTAPVRGPDLQRGRPGTGQRVLHRARLGC